MSQGWPKSSHGCSSSRSSTTLPNQDEAAPHSRPIPSEAEGADPPVFPTIVAVVTLEELTEIVSIRRRIKSRFRQVEGAVQDSGKPPSQIYSLDCFYDVSVCWLSYASTVNLTEVNKGLYQPPQANRGNLWEHPL